MDRAARDSRVGFPEGFPLTSAGVPPHQLFLVDEIMPEHEVHLIAGPSGAGKSTLAIQLFIKDYLAGNPVFGKITRPRPIAYVSCDRSIASFRRAMDRHGLPYDAFPVITGRMVPPIAGRSKLYSIMAWARAQRAHLVIVDGFGSLVPGGKLSEYAVVADFLVEAQKCCDDFDLTLMGQVHATKVKDSEKISNPRQRILGSVAWAAYSDLVITIDEENAEDPTNTTRVIHVLPRDAPSILIRMNQDSGGRLVTLESEAEMDLHSILDVMLSKIPLDQELKTQDLILKGFHEHVGRATIENWIAAAVLGGKLERLRRGWYRRIPVV